ncbi:MAG: TRAP transporter permease [Candidatus Lambdaproteobacteria bacterium]|nr:TRAP transporter permease [Candidatus Lambdaproteobacteria bacterium]
MSQASAVHPRLRAVVDVAYYLVAIGFFAQLLIYYVYTTGGPVLLAFTVVPVTFVLFVLDALRKEEFYPRLGVAANHVIALVYVAGCAFVSVYLYREFEAVGTVRAGVWSRADLFAGGLMFVLVMEYTRKRHFALFVINIVCILYAVYGWVVPGMFYHPGLSWLRIVTSMSLEEATGVFSSLPQLALTLIGSFVLVLAVLRAFGCVDSILKGAKRVAARSGYALPQAAVLGSMGVGMVSGSGAANAVTIGSATIPAMIGAGMPRAHAAAVETVSSLGGQLMPPVMGISAFLMADFLGRSYFDVVARGYAPALIYYAGVSLGVYLLSVRFGAMRGAISVESLTWQDWTNLAAFLAVVGGLVLLMAVQHLSPMFAALYTFAVIAALMLFRAGMEALLARGVRGWRATGRALLRFLDAFAGMTADLTLLLATLGILTSAFVNTGVPTKVGFILVDAAGVNIAVVAFVAFLFGALLGLGLPPAPTYILTALVIAPQLIKIGVQPWPVHFFAFFLAVWGELTPPTSIVAAVTAKIAEASFMTTLWHSIRLCAVLFVLMAAMFTRPELVLEPGLAQLGAAGLVLAAAAGVVFSLQATFHRRREIDWPLRAVLMVLALVALLHPDTALALLACVPVAGFVAYWVLNRRQYVAAAALESTGK